MEQPRDPHGDTKMDDGEELPPREFAELPVELRTKVIRGIANRHSYRQTLRLVSKDFNAIVAPIHFEVCPLSRLQLSRVQR